MDMPPRRSKRATYARRRKKHMARFEHDLTDAQWETMQSLWEGCAYCGVSDQALQRDCVQAISRGGRYTLDNVVPACRSCNASKWNDEVTGWLRRKKLNESEFLLRWVEIRDELAIRHPGEPEIDAT